MHRIDADGNISGLFTDGNPAIPQVATEVDAAWLNDVQENVCHAVEAAGITLVKGTYTQLTAAINALILAAATPDTIVDAGGANLAGIAHSLRFGTPPSGECIGSARSGGVNLFGLDFYTNSNRRMQLDHNGVLSMLTPDALVAPVTMNVVGGAGSSFASGWSGVTAHEKPSFWKQPDGTVRLVGTFYRSGGAVGSDNLCTLPAGFRPQSPITRPAAGNTDPANVVINTGGVVFFGTYNSSTSQYVSMDLAFNINTLNGP